MTRNKPYAEHWLAVSLPGSYWKTKSPVLPHKRSFHNSVIELEGWGMGLAGTGTFYQIQNVPCSSLLSPIFELTWRLTSESGLPVAREMI